jgi:hypothetical protein
VFRFGISYVWAEEDGVSYLPSSLFREEHGDAYLLSSMFGG